MPKLQDLTGHKYGRLTVLSIAERRRYGSKSYVFWYCVCDCGNSKIAGANAMKTGEISSCGCLKADTNKKRGTHNMTATKTYKLWLSMKSRCLYKGDTNFKNYGERGISFAPRWQTFENFLTDMGECPDGYSLERINVDGNYTPENCKWIPRKDQWLNTRRSIPAETIARIKQLVLSGARPKQISDETGISVSSFHKLRRRLNLY